MKYKIFLMLVPLILVGLYAITTSIKGSGSAVPTQTEQSSIRLRHVSQTVKPDTCKVSTGTDGGTVNLRECEGAACGAILDILIEGATLRVDVVKDGLWMNVTTADGVTGWLNSKYCKKDK